MLKHYLLIAYRNLIRNKTISLIHIFGLSLALAVFLATTQNLLFHLDFDNLHEREPQIFAVASDVTSSTESVTYLANTPAIVPIIREKIPEVRLASRYVKQGTEEPYCVVRYVDPAGKLTAHNEPNARYVDEDFLKIFSFPVLRGNRDELLTDPNSMVITESIARKYFGADDPIGKVVEVRTGGTETTKSVFSYRVSGVLADVPANSTLQFDILLPFYNLEHFYKLDMSRVWFWPCFYSFIMTEGPTNASELTQKINRAVPEDITRQASERGLFLRQKLIELEDLHFERIVLEHNNYLSTVDYATLVIVSLIGLSILLVAIINYVNLTTAQSIHRLKEIGIRRASGAGNGHLILRFLADAALLNSISFFLGVTILQVAGPSMQQWLGLSIATISWSVPTLGLMLLILLVSICLSGILPGWLLLNVDPLKALKNQLGQSLKGKRLRTGLVVVQFIVSAAFVMFTGVLNQQINYMQSKDPGFDTEQRIVIRALGTEDPDFAKFRMFQTALSAKASVRSVTAAANLPGDDLHGFQQFSTDLRPEEFVGLNINIIDYDFARTLGLRVVAGQEFRQATMSEERVILLSRSAVKKLGYDSPEKALGRLITYRGNKLRVIGVLEDLNTASTGNTPLATAYFFANTGHPYGRYRLYLIHVDGGALASTLDLIEEQWQEAFPGALFDYRFLDESFQRVFENDRQMRRLSGLASTLAMLIASLGLIGLVSFTTLRRTKEIGIRKTLGASVGNILVLLSRSFLKPIMIGLLIAIPVVWLVAEEFLAGYSYRISLDIWLFIIPVLMIIGVSLFIVNVQTIKAARANPVDSLRYE